MKLITKRQFKEEENEEIFQIINGIFAEAKWKNKIY